MAAKEVKFSVDARDKMLRGVEILANAVDPERGYGGFFEQWLELDDPGPARSRGLATR